eukprot:1674186-Rhodomonas_salina.1
MVTLLLSTGAADEARHGVPAIAVPLSVTLPPFMVTMLPFTVKLLPLMAKLLLFMTKWLLSVVALLPFMVTLLRFLGAADEAWYGACLLYTSDAADDM